MVSDTYGETMTQPPPMPARITLALRPFETVSIGTSASSSVHLTCGSLARQMILTAVSDEIAVSSTQ
jgi:hypothetical protein